MAVEYPGDDYLEKKRKEELRRVLIEMAEACCERLRRVTYDDWRASVRQSLVEGRSDEAIKAFDDGVFDKKFMRYFKKGRTYLQAVYWIVVPWEKRHGVYNPRYDDDDFEDDSGDN